MKDNKISLSLISKDNSKGKITSDDVLFDNFHAGVFDVFDLRETDGNTNQDIIVASTFAHVFKEMSYSGKYNALIGKGSTKNFRSEEIDNNYFNGQPGGEYI